MQNKLTLIKRSTPICPDCMKMQNMLEGEGISFDTIDIAKDESAIEKYNISSVPVILIDDEGTEIRLNGFQPINVIKELLD